MPMNTSRTRLKDDRPGRWTPAKWEQVIKNKTSLFEFEQMVIFVDGKEMVEKAETAVKSLGLSQRVTVDYFYRGRGTNKYQEFDAVVILGQAEPRSDAIVSEARALHRDHQYISEEVKSNNKRQFRDPRLQQFKESKQMDEIVQCLYRIRPATHQHRLGKKVVICTGFKVEGLTDQAEVVQLSNYGKSIEAEIRRAKLADQVSQCIAKYGYMTLANGLNGTLAKMRGESQVGRKFAEFAYNNIEENPLVSNLCEPSGGKGLGVSVRTLENDMKKLVDNGQIEAHRETIELNGKRYSPVVVYGSLDAFKADMEQAKAIIAERESRQGSRTDLTSGDQSPEVEKPTDLTSHGEPTEVELTDPVVGLLPFDQDTDDCISSLCQVRKETPVRVSSKVRHLLEHLSPFELDYLNSGEAVVDDLYKVYELDKDAADGEARQRAMVYRCIIEDTCNLVV